MLPANSKRTSGRLALFSVVSALLLLALASPASAKKSSLQHIFVISRVDIPKNAPPEFESLVKKQLLKAIAAQPNLLSAIPEDAPKIDESEKGLAGNKPFRNYMKRKGMRAYKVVVQVTSYEQTVDANPRKSGNVIGSHIVLSMFGETLPEHVMAFSGDGSAKVAIEVGNKIRPKDKEFADTDATEIAIADAIKMSLLKLQEGPPKRSKKKAKKKK